MLEMPTAPVFFFPGVCFSRVDTYDSKPYWFSNYTDIYVRIVVNNYSDMIIGE